MIDRDRTEGTMTLACDDCGEKLDAEEPSNEGVPALQRLVTAAKLKGWRVRREDGEWVHQCSDCTPDWVAEQRALLNRR